MPTVLEEDAMPTAAVVLPHLFKIMADAPSSQQLQLLHDALTPPFCICPCGAPAQLLVRQVSHGVVQVPSPKVVWELVLFEQQDIPQHVIVCLLACCCCEWTVLAWRAAVVQHSSAQAVPCLSRPWGQHLLAASQRRAGQGRTGQHINHTTEDQLPARFACMCKHISTGQSAAPCVTSCCKPLQALCAVLQR